MFVKCNKLKHDKTRYVCIDLLQWLKSKKLTIPIAVEDVEQQELSLIPGENAKWYSHLKEFGSFLQV